MMRVQKVLAISVFAVATTLSGFTPVAANGPAISLDKTSVKPGERVVVNFSGWTTGFVTMSLCGNLAKRGSSDCNMAQSQIVQIGGIQATMAGELVASPPPGTCPCVIRASNLNTGESAVAAIDLVGFPLGPVIDSGAQEPLDVSFEVTKARGSFIDRLRSGLGGRTTYEVTVVVKNQTSDILSEFSLSGSAERNSAELAAFDIPIPAEGIAPGEKWEHRISIELPSPVLGSYKWVIVASGAGPAVKAEETTNILPVVLIALVAVLLVDVAILSVRLFIRARRVLRTGRGRTDDRTILQQPEPQTPYADQTSPTLDLLHPFPDSAGTTVEVGVSNGEESLQDLVSGDLLTIKH